MPMLLESYGVDIYHCVNKNLWRHRYLVLIPNTISTNTTLIIVFGVTKSILSCSILNENCTCSVNNTKCSSPDIIYLSLSRILGIKFYNVVITVHYKFHENILYKMLGCKTYQVHVVFKIGMDFIQISLIHHKYL